MWRKLYFSWRQWSKSNLDIAALPFSLLAVTAIMTIATGGSFLSIANFSALMAQIPEVGLLSLAMMITMLTAGINLSIISTANLASVVMGLLLSKMLPIGLSGGGLLLFILAVILIGILISVLLGLFNGMLIAYCNIPAFLATLGTMIMFEGITMAITKGFVVSGFPAQFVAISTSTVLGIPYALIIFILAALFLSCLLSRRPFGKYLYMLGSSELATLYSGINTKMVILKTYALSGFFCGLAAVVMTARFNSANARQGASLLLITVLISVLGGTDPNGGFGKISGLIFALLILQFLSSGLNLLGISSFLTLALYGVTLVLAIAYRHFLNQKKVTIIKN